ncbi:unnamed protein product [Linum tenue]|uniref:Uncharacterized protein n=1 Tax=Linum tenue TaxID=586396 RepID=A0AAV0R5T7_9ROSI|nr:unnamed protein product [Linum tenue]
MVHPKGIVERLTRPTWASEVMKQYPRHCVTRPDVFKNPWIAVHPDSLLKLGCVFYVVPYLTINRLLKQHSPNLAATAATLFFFHRPAAAKGIYGLFHGDDRFRSARQAQI